MEELNFDPLGDGISSVVLIDHTGSDLGIAQAARVSYGADSKGEKADAKLIKYLYKHKHWTPFRHQVMKFKIKCPLFVARQWRTHNWAEYEGVQWVFNEVSARYTEMKDEFYISDPRYQASSNKQGSKLLADLGIDPEELKDIQYQWERHQTQTIFEATRYRDLALDNGIAKELANRLLPQNVYTSFIWTVNLHSLGNFISLRTDEHAQWEIRQYAIAISRIVSHVFPVFHECLNAEGGEASEENTLVYENRKEEHYGKDGHDSD